MKLIEHPLDALRHYSTQALAASAAIPALWASVPDEVKVFVPADKMAIITAVVAGAGFLGKFVKQKRTMPTVALPKSDDGKAVAAILKDAIKERGEAAALDLIKKALK